jgi:cephalosporin hydroxylase
MNISLGDLKRLADELPGLPDGRPQWIKDLPYTTQDGSSYYKFLWELCRRHKPERTLEIGIDKAGSTLSMAAANPEGTVVSMDINPGACENAQAIAQRHEVKNLGVLHQDSLKVIAFERPFDLMFLDSWHSFEQVYREYVLYRPFMKQGAIILFDDIRYSKEMSVAWDLIPDPKIELPSLHHSGFGACRVDKDVNPVGYDSIATEAKRRYS